VDVVERLEVDVLGYLVSCSCAPAADWDGLAADDRDLKSPMMMNLAVRGGFVRTALCLLFTNREMPCVWSVERGSTASLLLALGILKVSASGNGGS
jgi:hypothetical protein